MAAVDYIGGRNFAAVAGEWDEALGPYRRRGRPRGDRSHSALLVVDVQRYFCDAASPAYLPASPHILPRIRELVESFRAAGSPVLFARHALEPGAPPGRMADWWRHLVYEGEPWADLSPDAGARASDHVIRKARYDAFEDSALAEALGAAGIDTLVICGVMTHLCCESTARAAFARGLHVWVALDATASLDEELHLGALRALAHGFATVAAVAQVIAWRCAPETIDRATTTAAPTGAPHTTSTARWTPPATAELASSAVDVIVIGAGPAGLAAGTQAARHGLDGLVIEADEPGGLLREADWVENYPGSAPLPGAALCERLTEWATKGGVRVLPGRAERLVVEDSGVEVHLQSVADTPGLRLRCRAVVIATGTRALRAGFTGEHSLAGAIVFYETTRLRAEWGPRPAGRAIIIGGGDAAFDQGVGLLRRGWRVRLLVRGRAPRALPLLQRRLVQLGGEVWLDTSVTGAERDGDGLRIDWQRRSLGADVEGTAGELRAERLLIAVGRSPRQLDLVDRRQDGSHPPPVVLAGDVRRGLSRQCAIAVGDGVAAAMALADALGPLATALPLAATPGTDRSSLVVKET